MVTVSNESFFDQQIIANHDTVHYKRCNFSRSMIGTSTYKNCIFEDCNFTNTFARGITFDNCTFVNCLFEYTYLRGASISDSLFEGCTFNNTDMQSQTRNRCKFDRCELRHADFGGCRVGPEWILEPSMLLIHGDGHVYKSATLGHYPVSWNNEWLQVGCSLDTVANWKSHWSTNKEYIYRQSDIAKDWADKYMDIILGMIDD